ncbi:unnamed protein product [Miscanthus lutarioriparius]|uniref:Uncharacterized protein n=1 Tax=Miscanthus lutarioriparius TaxID=422564 RepID=A0A811QUU6_9POAL|nr:unnamed protein product [Miscanthus lutarioriparius]
MEKALSDLHALKKLYGLLQRLDETSRALLKKLLDDATCQALLKQANALTTASDSVIRFSLGLTSPRKMDLNNKGTEMEQILSDLEALTKLYSLLHKGPADENLDEASGALLMKILEDATQEAVRSQARMLSGSLVSPVLERKLSTLLPDTACRSAPEAGGITQTQPPGQLHGRATPRYVEAESSSSSSVHLFERMDSGLSLSMTSRHGVEHAERGVATPERSSSSNTMATIQSRIRPSNNLLKEGSLHRSAAEERRTSRRRQQGSDVSSADMYSSSMSSGSRSSSGAASLSASTSPMASPAPHAFANPYYYYSPPVMTRGIAPPVYAPKVSRSMRRRRRQEILEKRLARLQMLKHKIATVFHHRHDHHHHLGGGQEAGPSSRSVVRGAGHFNTPWQYFTSMFHRAKGKDKNARSRTVRHLKGKRRAPAGMKLRRKASRVRGKKMHWWQRGMAGVTAGSRPRRRLGHGKAGWL